MAAAAAKAKSAAAAVAIASSIRENNLRRNSNALNLAKRIKVAISAQYTAAA